MARAVCFPRGGLRDRRDAVASTSARGARAVARASSSSPRRAIATTTTSVSNNDDAGGPAGPSSPLERAPTRRRPLAPGYALALECWRAGYVDDAAVAFENHLALDPRDVSAWISYAQMLKRPRGDERVVPSSVDDDVACSRESVNRARRVLHRALLELRRRQSDCDDADPEAMGKVLQALGLLELTHGNEMYGGALLEQCVRVSRRALEPVLRWRRVRAARANVVARAGVGRLNKTRESVRAYTSL